MKTDAEISPAIVSGIVTGDAPFSYWPIFCLSQEKVPESLKSLLFRVQVCEKILLWDFVDLTLKKC